MPRFDDRYVTVTRCHTDVGITSCFCPASVAARDQTRLGGLGSYTVVLGDYANFNAPRTFGIEATVAF